MILSVQYRYGTIFREVMHHEFEWCSTMDGTTENLVGKAIGGLLRNSKSGVYDPCPIAVVSLAKKNYT